MSSILRLLLLLTLGVAAHADAGESYDTPAKQPAATPETATMMKGSHLHFLMADLPGAVRWLDKVWHLQPSFQNERMAVLSFGEISIILDASTTDTVATLGFDSQNCDEDFQAVQSRGGLALEVPKDRPWGVRSAYIQGPGALKFEIEQALPRQEH